MHYLILFLFTLINTTSFVIDETKASTSEKTISQELFGAWKTDDLSASGVIMTSVMILSDGFLSIATHQGDGHEFVSTKGGSWSIANGTITIISEFDTENPGNVGTSSTKVISIKGKELMMGEGSKTWTRVDYGTPGALAGSWLITGRKNDDGEITKRTPGARKTMKILSGTRFQWIAYNTDTGEFFGTGGGTYTTENGKYVENIDFFSRDNSRVGAVLDFKYELDLAKGDWHHSGLSSKGSPIYEVWTLRSML